jgi:predicted transcriptional regulator
MSASAVGTQRARLAKSDGLGRKEGFTAKHGMREIVCPDCEETYTAI